MRRSGLVLFSATVAACFSPEVSDGGMSGSDTDATNTGGATASSGNDGSTTDDGSTTTVDPDTTVGPPDTGVDTTSGDAPPIFESFTVNGSTTPAEVAEGGTILLEADVTDDVGLVSVEFFDGATSLGVVTESPFELEIPVSSADSGSHTYTAVATDTADQMTESEEVTMSVNIVGGVVEILREDLFVGADGVMFVNGGLDAGMNDRVFLSAVPDGGGSSQVMSFNDGLSQLWSRTYGEQVPGGPTTVANALVIGGANTQDLTLVYRSLAPETGDTLASVTFETTAEFSGDLIGGGMIAGFDGNVVLTESLQHLAAYPPELDDRSWLANALPLPIDLAARGSALFTSVGDTGDECAMGANYCVRRYDTNGQTTWTAGLPSSNPAFLAPHPDGGVFAAVGFGDMGYEVFRLDAAGMVSDFGTFSAGEEQYLSGAAADGSGGLVVSGATGPYASGRAFVTRIGANGDVIWDQRQFFNNSVESAALDVVIDGGNAFVFGLANNVSDFLGFTGDAWVARVSL